MWSDSFQRRALAKPLLSDGLPWLPISCSYKCSYYVLQKISIHTCLFFFLSFSMITRFPVLAINSVDRPHCLFFSLSSSLIDLVLRFFSLILDRRLWLSSPQLDQETLPDKLVSNIHVPSLEYYVTSNSRNSPREAYTEPFEINPMLKIHHFRIFL